MRILNSRFALPWPCIVLVTGGVWQSTSSVQAQNLESRLQMARLHSWKQMHEPKRLAAHRLVMQPEIAVVPRQKFEVPIPLRHVPAVAKSPKAPQAYRIVSSHMMPVPTFITVQGNTVNIRTTLAQEEDAPRIVEPSRKPLVPEAQGAPQPQVIPQAQAIDSGTATATGAEVANANSGVSIPAPSGSPDRPQASLPETLPQSTPNGPSGTATTGETTTGEAGAGAGPGDVVVPRSERRPISVYVDGRLGFDRGVQVSNVDSPVGPIPLAINVKRSVRSVSVSASYPLGQRTSLSLGIPYVSQRTESSALGRTLKRRGSGIGDVSLFITQRLPEVRRGTEVSLSGGLIFPTGRNPFELRPNELPTGNGFYQALLRFSISKMVVPLQFFASFDYGKSAARTFNGQRLRLPDEYGAQIGFFYTLSPEFSSQTSLSYSKQSSPFLLQPGATVAYFTQALSYNANPTTVLRSSVDVGLTEEATDAYVNFSVNRQF